MAVATRAAPPFRSFGGNDNARLEWTASMRSHRFDANQPANSHQNDAAGSPSESQCGFNGTEQTPKSADRAVSGCTRVAGAAFGQYCNDGMTRDREDESHSKEEMQQSRD
jgi:hypothetical protein